MTGSRAGRERAGRPAAPASGRALDRDGERLVALHRLSTLVAQQRRSEDVLREALRSAVSLIGGDAGAIHRWFPETQTLRCVIAEGRHEPIIRSELTPGIGLTGRVFQEQRSIIENDYAKSRIGTAWSRQAGLRTGVAVPVMSGGRCLAIISVGSYDPVRLFYPDDAQLLELFAAMVGVALENAELYSSVRRSEAQLQQVIDHSPAAISLKDRDGRYLLTNRRWHEMFGSSANLGEAGPIGRTAAELLPDERAKALRERDLNVLTTGQTMEYEGTVIGGSQERTYHAVKFPLVDAEGQPYAVCSMSTDVTERRRWEQEIATALKAQRAANEQLERLNKAKSDFVSIVSHELRSPLTGIQGFSELMRDEVMSLDEMREYSADINREAERLNRMISEVLDLDRMESGRMTLSLEPVDPGILLTGLVASTASRTRHHQFQVELDPSAPIVSGDRDKLTQVMVNLLDNAIKYSPEGGEIVVGAGRDGDAAHLWVRDQGLGIPAEALEAIFERYTRIESDRYRAIHGTGLGLPIVRQIVELHGGRVWAESAAGVGSTFHVVLPAAGPSSDQPGA